MLSYQFFLEAFIERKRTKKEGESDQREEKKKERKRKFVLKKGKKKAFLLELGLIFVPVIFKN